MTKYPDTRHRLALTLEPELKDRLQAHCDRIGGKMAAVTKLAIREYLDRNKTAQDRRY